MSRAKLSDIIECLAAHGRLSLPGLCALLNSSPESTRAVVKSLRNSGFVELSPSDSEAETVEKYQLTPLGRHS